MQIFKKIFPTFVAVVAMIVSASTALGDTLAGQRPNILVIVADDVTLDDVGAYKEEAGDTKTPNIDRIASEGARFDGALAPGSGTAGRAAMISGQNAYRTGLLERSAPHSEHGFPDWSPTIALLLGEQGYTTGHFGLSTLGSRDTHLPTKHGFDYFYGIVHEPGDYEDADMKLRGVLRSRRDGWIEDTGPVDVAVTAALDDAFTGAAIEFIEEAVEGDRPFFVWLDLVQTHTGGRTESAAVRAATTMHDHDDDVGALLDKLDKLGIASNTVVVYTTDNSPAPVSVKRAAGTFGMAQRAAMPADLRVPALVRWPAAIAAGTHIAGPVTHEDWLPTLLSAAGDDAAAERLADGYRIDGERYRVHLDGYDFLPRLHGETTLPPRAHAFFFNAEGDLIAVRSEGLPLPLEPGDQPAAAAPVVSAATSPFDARPHRRRPDYAVMPAARAAIAEFRETLTEYPIQYSPGTEPAESLSFAGGAKSFFERAFFLRDGHADGW